MFGRREEKRDADIRTSGGKFFESKVRRDLKIEKPESIADLWAYLQSRGWSYTGFFNSGDLKVYSFDFLFGNFGKNRYLILLADWNTKLGSIVGYIFYEQSKHSGGYNVYPGHFTVEGNKP